MRFFAALLIALVGVLVITTTVSADYKQDYSNGINPNMPTITIDIQREKKPGFFSRTFRGAGQMFKKIANRRRKNQQFHIMQDPYRNAHGVWVTPPLHDLAFDRPAPLGR